MVSPGSGAVARALRCLSGLSVSVLTPKARSVVPSCAMRNFCSLTGCLGAYAEALLAFRVSLATARRLHPENLGFYLRNNPKSAVKASEDSALRPPAARCDSSTLSGPSVSVLTPKQCEFGHSLGSSEPGRLGCRPGSGLLRDSDGPAC